MIRNEVVDTLMSRRSVRSYTDREPTCDEVETVVRAGQQAPFAMQLGSVLLTRDRERNPFRAPLQFVVCVDVHRMDLVMRRRGWQRRAGNSYTLLFGIQDACYMAENMVIAGESLGMGSCFIGGAPFTAGRLRERHRLPDGVFPLVILAMGFPAEERPVRPRYPIDFHLFEETYPDLSEEEVERAMEVMDDGYLAEGYYRRAGYMVSLPEGMEETFDFDSYSWTEHISRKLGLRRKEPDAVTGALSECGLGPEAEDGRRRGAW